MNNDKPYGGFSGKAGIEKALKQLNAKMVYAELPPVELVSCGGASLNLMGWVSRSTSDVDVICVAKVISQDRMQFLDDTKLPKRFAELITEVGHELSLSEQWLNFAPAPLLKFGLPHGLKKRLTRKSFGRCLALHVISRLDQIHLKLFAAMDPNTRIETHLGDLMELEPTETEALAAVKWLLKRKTSAGFRRKLKSVLDRIGHDKLAQTI